jgi:aspartate/methionine/tyrosine aminotransferase
MADPHRLARRACDIAPFRVVEVMEQAWNLERQGRSIIRLVAGEPDFGTPPSVVSAAAASASDGRVHYTSSLGIPPLKEAIAEYYARRFGVTVPASRIAVTTGASSALLLALAVVMEAGERVLLTDPGYPCNRSFVRLFEGSAVGVPVDASTAYQLTAAHVHDHWDEHTRATLLATPSNPTGTIVPPDELTAIADTTARLGGTLLVDEIYGELVYDVAPSTVLSHTQDVFVVNSFSKTFGMTGWRLGWLVVPPWALEAVERLAQNLYISPPAPAQWGGVAAFTPEVWAEVERRRLEFQARRDLMVAGLREIGFAVPVSPAGAFYIYADCHRFGNDSSAVAARLLDQAGVAVTPGNDFGVNGAERHLRVSYTTARPQLEAALERMAMLLG